MELNWLDPERPDRRDLAGAVAVREATRAADTPQLRPDTLTRFAATLRHGWDGDPPRSAVAWEGGRVVGLLSVDMPHWDNTHLGDVTVIVDPTARRRGLGRLLFDAGVERVRAEGRSLLVSDCFEGSPGESFLTALGFERASLDVSRRQDLAAVDWTHLDRIRADSESRASAYELVRIAGETPAELLPAVSQLTASINDAPTDELEIEDEVFSPERVREMEKAQRARGQRLYRLLARHRETGDLAGHTIVAVESERPWLGEQLDTSVAREHRGHRLGLLLKVAMLHWMREEEPQLRDVSTWNAASNTHMVRVNEALGYTVVARMIGWQRRL